ncbi:non-ribosomal peptide synthetase [Sphaerisporangium sp. NPDC051017]|uniref:non-ribosomal peptide synthetase n=1 Tax=Sphaerisporangium sp. NPDC051017 TaxID=3154636 RepID=UPI00341F5E90
MDTLISLFHRAVEQNPDCPAVTDDACTLTYAELDRRSDSVATALREHGFGSEDRVGVHVHRSTRLFVAILGILKAGCAYVSVDTRYPGSRRDLMLRESGAEVVLTDADFTPALSVVVPTVMLVDEIDGHDGETAAAPARRSDPTPASAASVLFTSGSSGTPKAIVLEHRNLVSFATNPSLPQLTRDDRVGQISSVSFDAFHFEMWSTIAAGAEIVVLPPVPDLLAADFQRQMRRYRISAMLVPTMVINHVVYEDRDAFASLRLLQAGGDVILPSACRDLLSGRFEGTFYNLYGPAEITTCCTAHLITAEDAETDSIPIGLPLHGVTLHVLSPDLMPVARGKVGELFVGGSGVGRGYLGAPELTAQRFLEIGGERLYRTGDLVQQREDGVYLFVGRTDDQIKVRGYRIEPGEVERGLRRHRGVQDAAVLPDSEGDDRRLVAFVVLENSLSLKDLRAHAQAELPDYMVPSDIIVLTTIPASEHGKRDTGALRELLGRHRERTNSYVAPSTDTERYLGELWAELLGVEKVGVQEDFFALGGHSLQAFRVQRRIKRELGVRVDNSTLLSNTVLGDLAKVIDALIDEALAR